MLRSASEQGNMPSGGSVQAGKRQKNQRFAGFSARGLTFGRGPDANPDADRLPVRRPATPNVRRADGSDQRRRDRFIDRVAVQARVVHGRGDPVGRGGLQGQTR